MTSVRESLNVVGQSASIKQLAHQRNEPFPLSLRTFVGAPPPDLSDFPENEIEILREYVSDDLSELMEKMRAGLNAADISITGGIIGPNANLVQQILSARRQVGQFLNHPAFDHTFKALHCPEGDALCEPYIGKDFSKHEFGLAQEKIEALADLASVPRVVGFGNAFHTAPVIFREIVGGNPEGGPVFSVERTLLGYGGPIPTAVEGTQILTWSSFLSKDAEWRFQVDLLRAEASAGLRRFDEAITLYEALLTATPSGSLRHKFVAIRFAFARLALADQLFRKQRALNDQDRENIIGEYDAAVGLLQEKGVSPDNPRRQQVEAHASQQKAKFQRQLNSLGLRDAFVPVQRYSKLEEIAGVQIEDAIASALALKAFLEEAETKAEQQRDIQFQKGQEELSLGILDLRKENATLSVDKIEEQLRAIDDQQKFLVAETVVGGLGAIVAGAAAGTGKSGNPALGVATGAIGVLGALVNFGAQREQLQHQWNTAEIEKDIGENEVQIADLEKEISKRRIEFYEQKLAFLENRRLNADFLYLMAELEEKRAERQLDVAIFLAYLFERALAFFMGKPNIRHIQFEYLDRPLGIFKAAKDLRDDFRLVQQEFASVTQEKPDFFNQPISLRESYPIQFSRFLQTGEMDFVYSLYQLSKLGPATHQCRLREVGVEVVGLLPPTGFRGTLTHRGRFLVRDKEATIRDPDATRLVPDEQTLAQALEKQRRLGLPVAAVGGVLYYDLEPDTKELSLDTQFVSPVPRDRPDRFTLNLFEGHGPTGLWHLKIQDHGRLAISDILIHFAIVSRESDVDVLQPKVEALIRAYEADLAEGDLLDRFSVFSLRQNFPDTFFALQSGPAGLSLGEENFESGLTNLQFKMVIAQALDQRGRGVPGVTLEISRQEVGFNQVRVTQTDGFSEDLDAPPQTLPRDQRFPVIGTWQIRLSNPAQFAQLGDLRLFFMYAFEEL